jgi:hypothetical protein
MNPFAPCSPFNPFPNMTPFLRRLLTLWTVLLLSCLPLRALDVQTVVTFNGYPLRNALVCIQNVACLPSDGSGYVYVSAPYNGGTYHFTVEHGSIFIPASGGLHFYSEQLGWWVSTVRYVNLTSSQVSGGAIYPTLNEISAVSGPMDTAVDVPLAGIGPGLNGDIVQTVSVTAASGSPSVVTTPEVTYTSGSTGTLRLRPNPGVTGSSTITVTVTRQDRTQFSRTFTYTVNPVPLNPVSGLATALDLNGTNQFVQLPGGTWFGNTYTVESWVYLRSYANWSRLFDFGNGEGVDNILGAISEGTSGKPRLNSYVGGTLGGGIVSPEALPLNTWTHLAFTREASGTGRIFINGVEKVSGPLGAASTAVRTRNYIGRSNWAVDSYTDGMIADFRIWNVSRTAQQILDNRHGVLPPSTTGLIAEYRFNEGWGTVQSGPNPTTPVTVAGTGNQRLLPSFPFANNSFSVEFMAKRNAINGNDYMVLQGPEGLNTKLHIGFRDSNNFTFAFYANDINTAVYTDTDWHHWACTYDATNNRRVVYRDGVAVATDTAPADYQGTGPVYLGASVEDPGFVFNGSYSDVRFWSVNRTATEIAENRNRTLPKNTPGLLASYADSNPTVISTADLASSSANPDQGGAQNGVVANNAVFLGTDAILGRTIRLSRSAGQKIVLANLGTLMPTDRATIEFWQYTDAQVDQSSVSLFPSATSRIIAHVPWSDGTIYWDFGDITGSGEGRLAYVPPVSPVGRWNHFAFVRSASPAYMAIYRNGVQEAYKVSNTLFSNQSGNLEILPDGRMADFRIWTVARSQDQIAANRFAPVDPATSGLLVNLRFDETSGATVADSATQSGAQNGTIVNGATFPRSQTAALATLLGPTVQEGDPRFLYLPGGDRNSAISYVGASASNAVLTSIGTGTYLYRPNPGFVGTDSLTYTISDGSRSSTSSVPVTVNAVNNPPVVGSGTGLDLNGVNQYASITNLSIANGSFTVEFWARRAAVNTWDVAVSQGTAVIHQGLHVGFRPNNTFTFAFWGNDLDTPVYTDLNWHHWSCTYDAVANRRTIYRDGVQVATDTATADYQGTGVVTIGQSATLGEFFGGSISDLRVWNTARTAQQVADSMHPGIASGTSGLLSHLRFNEGDGGVAFDASGNGRQAYLHNSPAWRPWDAPLASAEMNGTFAQAQDSAAVSITGPITLEAWVRPAVTGNMGLIEKYDTTEGGYALRTGGTGRLEFYTLDNNAAWTVLNGTTPLPANVWTHVAAVWDGTLSRLYVNGVLDGVALNGRNPKDGASSLIIGATGVSGQNFRFNGRMADVRIWNVARTQGQISWYRGGVPANTAGLVVNYRFAEGSGSTLSDAATADGTQNATFASAPTWPSVPEPGLATLQIARYTEDVPLPLFLPGRDVETANSSLVYSQVVASSGTLATASGNGNFTYTPAANVNGPVTVTYRVSDGTLTTDGRFYLQGVPVDDVPTLGTSGVIASQTIDEGSASTATFPVTDGDPELVQSMSLQVTSSNTNLIRNPTITFGGTDGNATVAFKGRPGANGSVTLTVIATQTAGSPLSTTNSFVVTIRAVDDAPNVGPANSLAFNSTLTPATLSQAAYVRIPGFGTNVPTSEITIEFWQNVRENANQSTFQLTPDNTANRINAHVPWGNGQVFWDFGNIVTGGRLAYTPPVPIVGTWQHFAFVASASGNYMKIFRNGIEEASKPGVTPFLPADRELRLGLFLGSLAEFRVWKVARTSEQILSTLHASVTNEAPDLVAYYRFNQRPLTQLRDFASLPGQAGSQDGLLVSDTTSAENDPAWNTLQTGSSGNLANLSWQTPDPTLAALQTIRVGDGTTTNLFLPAFDAENGLTLTWQGISASTGAVTHLGGGIVRYVAPVGHDGPASIGYSVQDSAGKVTSSSVQLRVFINQNDAPTISAIPNNAAEEDSSLIEVPFTVDDDQPPGNLVITPVLLENGSLLSSVSVSAGTQFRRLVLVPKPGEIGTVRIRLLVQDSGQKSAQSEFELRIEPKPAYSVFDLGVVPGKSASFGTAINDRGAVTGFMTDTDTAQNNPVGFFFNGIENGGVVDSNPPIQVGPSPLTSPFRAWAINNGYTLAGSGRLGGQTVAWSKGIEGTIANLGVLPSATFAEARAINAAGLITGFGTNSGNKRRAFIHNPGDGLLTDLGVAPFPFNEQSDAFAVNDEGHLVGSIFNLSGHRRAMIRTNNVLVPLLTVPNDTNSVAYDINSFDQVVGTTSTFAGGDSALSFDGTADTAEATNLLTNPTGVPLVAGNAPVTVEAWIRIGSLPSNRSWPLLLGNAANGQSIHWLVNPTDGGNLQVGFFGLAGSTNIPVRVGSWMHVATVYDPQTSRMTVYRNGQPFTTNTVTGVDLQGIPLTLGKAYQSQNFFNGALDEVRVWKVARTGTQIASAYTQKLAGNETGLVLYLPFDEGSGTVSTTSLANGNIQVRLTDSPVWTVRAGLPSPAIVLGDAVLQLDGVSAQATGPSLALTNTSFTVEFRARRTAVGKINYVVTGGTGQTSQGLHVGFRENNVFTFAFYANDLNTGPYPDTDWHHWACTYNRTNRLRRIYRDGALVVQDTSPSDYLGTGPLLIGNSLLQNAAHFGGALSELRIWNVARSAEEVAAHSAGRLAGSTSGLIAHYPLDEGGGNTAANRVAGGSPLSLGGAIAWAGRDDGFLRGFFYNTGSGRLQSIGTVVSGGASEARGINDFGQIVGSESQGAGSRAILFSSGKLNDLNDLLPEAEQLDDWKLEVANRINKVGAIVGSGTHKGLKRAFLAIPATLIGRPVIRPQGAVERYPEITILRKERSDDNALNSFFWSPAEKKLYAIRPVIAKIQWYTSFSDTVGSGTEVLPNTERVVSVTANVWPKNPIIHIAGAPVDMQPAATAARYSFQSLIYVTNNATVEPSSLVFRSPTPGYTVAHYYRTEGQPVDPSTQSPHFDVIRTVDWTDSAHAGLVNADATIGTEVTDPRHTEYESKNGYVLLEKAAYDSIGTDRAYNRGNRLGPILPVNTEKPDGNELANPDPLVVVWYSTNRIGVAWASHPVRYRLQWPSDETVDRIIIASTEGSGYLDPADYPAKTYYNQPDITQPGFNPNEEHAYMPVDTLFAIRDDLNEDRGYSLPYALLKFRDPTTDRWRMRVFKVVAEQAPYFFTYSGTAGKEIQPPLPLSVLPLQSQSFQDPVDSEVGWEDYKGKIYARQAGPEGSRTNLMIRWFYPMQPGFFHPDPTVTVGTPLAWLDRRPSGQLRSPNQGLGVRGLPIGVVYDIRWDDAPVLQIGQTLVRSTDGLPNVYDMANARVIFDTLSAENPGASALVRSIGSRSGTPLDPITLSSTSNSLARFYDPISARTLKSGVAIPTSLKRQNISGKDYFSDLPWFLKIRLSYDPINNWLSFAGHLDPDFGVGEPLLLPNVLTARERDRIKELASGDSNWGALVDRLYALTRNPNQVDLFPADGVPDNELRLGLRNLLSTNFYPVQIERRGSVLIPQVSCFSNILIEPFCLTNQILTEVWPPESLPTPTSMEEALNTDARILFDIQRGAIRVPGGGSPRSSFSVTRQVVGETLESGPKVLTTGLGGVPAATTRPGRALSFNGSSGFVTVGLSNGLSMDLTGTPFTIEFWAKVQAPLVEQYIVGQPSGPADLGRLRLGFRDGGRFAFDLGTTPASISVFSSSSTYTDTGWHHWAGTFDNESKIQTLYRDGVAIDSRSNPALDYLGSGTLELGRFGTNFFGGTLDEFRIWKTARTASEIRANMNKRLLGSGVHPNLELIYRCDEAQGPLLSDALVATGVYSGTLTGGVSLVTSDAPTGIPPRYLTIAENNDPALGGLPVTLRVIRVDDGPYLGDLKVLPGDNIFDERLTLRHSSEFGGDPEPVTFQWFYKPIGADFDPTDLPIVADPTAAFPSDMRGWTPYTNHRPQSGAGVNYVTTGEGGESGLITISDNAFICRYKGFAVNLASASAWSGWVGDPAGTPEQPRAALAEGWVKRVVRGLNPFDARTSDFHSSPASTFSSMLIQAGQRYEGPIAFNPSADAINRVGLIEAYATVLDRARGLSIDGVPQVDFNPANNSLLLAASRVADLYVVLGNEAYADASDPTIGFGSSSAQYGSLSSSIFTFQNQLDSPLEEELTLLRGRDDKSAGVGANPVYNRLFWNFTLGEGEVAYQQNYNISDQNLDGFIDERDARILYPQGHGDAWGHYLSAIRQHYELLKHPYFTWIPRSELVSVGGAAIKVDFLDERKFAAMAAAKARAGAEIVNLTYRLNYVDDPSGQWQGYKDTDTSRAWGVTEWAHRAGTAAYFDWITGNTLLPSTDPNPAHTGIDKIDRQTVRELHEIPAQFDEIQSRLDQADAGLNPLGLAKGVVTFDIDPSQIAAGRTHFEQIQTRALKSMTNAVAVWDEVNKATQALRRTQDSVEQFTSNVNDQERDYKNRLIEIFGYPHAGDIGAGKTYPSGYDGPDLYHYMYTPVPDYDGLVRRFDSTTTSYFTGMDLGITASGDTQSAALGDSSQQFYFPSDFASDIGADPAAANVIITATSNRVFAVQYPRMTGSYAFSPPPEWGQRRAPGELQLALSDLIQNEARLRIALKADSDLLQQIDDAVELLNARYGLQAETLRLKNQLSNTKIGLVTGIIAAKIGQKVMSGVATTSLRLGDIAADGFPKVVGLASDVTSVGRVTVRMAALAMAEPFEKAAGIVGALGELTEKVGLEVAQSVTASGIQAAEFKYDIQKQVTALEILIRSEAGSRLEAIRQAETVRQSTGRYLSALAKGQRLLEERVAYRKKVAARTTENRYQDMTFRIFRNDALQKYRASFDLAQRYVFLAATAYDYESNLLGTDSRAGRDFLTDIIRQRSLGQMLNGEPIAGRSGLADPLARMNNNFEVLKTQLGFNNPQTETARFSLRNELFRLRDSSSEDWKSRLTATRVPNLWDIPEFRRYCRSFAPESAGPQPGMVIRFPSTVTAGRNFFNWPLGGGDSAYDSSRFATKVRSAGVWFTGYNGLGLSQTPRIYLVPAGEDILSSPTPNDFTTRSWRVIDQQIPVPFPIGANRLRDPGWIPINDSVGGTFAEVRRFSSFRAYHDGGFTESQMTTDSRLIGRSVWNTDWVLIIPGQTFLNNADTGLDRFIDSVSDIKLFFQTYSYSGN